MAADHQHQVLTHEFRPTSNWSMTTDAYMTHFARNWYKLDRMVDSSGTKWALGDVLAEGGEMLGWLQGADTPEGAGLDMKANNRRYGSAGVQHRGMWGCQSKHRVSYGFRLHQDWMDRNEWRDRYAMQEGAMVLTLAGDSGSASNRLEQAQAAAGYVRGALHWGRWTVTPGIRHEWMVLSREEFGEDLQRIERGDIRSHVVSAWLPGAGVHYQLVPDLWTAFAGVHRGFVPPGSNPDTQPEFSTHVEIGSRLSTPYVNGQLTLFYSEHDNLLGSDLSANGGTGAGDLFNGGASMARGLELEMVSDLLELTGADALFEEGKHHVPVRLSYTFTQAQFTQSFESDFDPWGTVSSGDELPYVAPHQGSLSASWESSRWSVDVNLRATGAMRTVAGQGDLIATQSTDAMMVIDAGARWKSDDHVEWFVGATNVTDEIYVVARRPYGARPGMPRALRLGATVVF
jgi:Fe(3+) dicitrate transport protein